MKGEQDATSFFSDFDFASFFSEHQAALDDTGWYQIESDQRAFSPISIAVGQFQFREHVG